MSETPKWRFELLLVLLVLLVSRHCVAVALADDVLAGDSPEEKVFEPKYFIHQYLDYEDLDPNESIQHETAPSSTRLRVDVVTSFLFKKKSRLNPGWASLLQFWPGTKDEFGPNDVFRKPIFMLERDPTTIEWPAKRKHRSSSNENLNTLQDVLLLSSSKENLNTLGDLT